MYWAFWNLSVEISVSKLHYPIGKMIKMSRSPEQLIITYNCTRLTSIPYIYMAFWNLSVWISLLQTEGKMIKSRSRELIITSSLSRFWSFSIASIFKHTGLCCSNKVDFDFGTYRYQNYRKHYRQMIKIGDLSSTTFKMFKMFRCCPKQTLHCFTHQGVHFPLQILLPACLK